LNRLAKHPPGQLYRIGRIGRISRRLGPGRVYLIDHARLAVAVLRVRLSLSAGALYGLAILARPLAMCPDLYHLFLAASLDTTPSARLADQMKFQERLRTKSSARRCPAGGKHTGSRLIPADRAVPADRRFKKRSGRRPIA
jgi:hypothetical protein